MTDLLADSSGLIANALDNTSDAMANAMANAMADAMLVRGDEGHTVAGPLAALPAALPTALPTALPIVAFPLGTARALAGARGERAR